MAFTPILLNGSPAVSARILMPNTGVWIADVDIDLDVIPVVPSGKAVLTVGTTLLIGTIDPRATAKFGAKAKVQLVGGGGGWDTVIPGQHYHADFGVLSTQVFTATAATVGETVLEAQPPKAYGPDFVVAPGPASSIFAGQQWYVTTQGVTTVGARVPFPADPTSVDILSWDGTTKRAELASDDLIQPGTILLDVRFGTARVRDVEQTFGADGARTIAWCDVSDVPVSNPLAPAEPPGGRLARALAALARQACGVNFLRSYHYRVVLQGVDGRVKLQLIDLTAPAPAFLNDVEVWTGLAGTSAKYKLGTEVAVLFLDGNPAQPIVLGASAKALYQPLEVDIDAIRVAVGLGTSPVALSSGVTAAINGLITAVSSATGANPAGITAATAALTSIPSTKLFSD